MKLLYLHLREWMAEQGKRGNVAVSNMGKLKTAAQMLAIIGLIWQYDSWMMYLSYGLLYIATFLTLEFYDAIFTLQHGAN